MNTNNTKQAAWVATGSLFKYGFTVVSSMILSRYFSKADYGTYKQVMYVYHTLLMVFTLGLPKAFSYFLPRIEPDQAKSLIRKLTNLFFVLGGAFSLILFVFSPQIAIILKNPDLTKALRVFAIVPLLMLPTMGLEGILATYKKTKFLTIYNIVTQLVMLFCVALPVMIWGLGYIEALWGFVVASVVAFVLALYFKYMPVKGLGNKECQISYKEIFQFSLPLLYASIWGIVITSADQFFISRYFGNEVFAEFSNGAIDLPFVTMITGACATVLSPVFSRLNHEQVDPMKEVYPLWMSVFEKSAKLIYPLLVYCWVFADTLMIALYGQQYAISDIYFRIKSISYFFSIIVFAPLLINIGKVKLYSQTHMFIAIAVVLLEFVFVKIIKSPVTISIVSLLCQLAKTFILLYAVTKYFGIPFMRLFPIKLLITILIPSIIILLPEHYLFSQLFNWNIWLELFVSFGFFMILYLIFSHFAKIDYKSIIKPLLK